KSLGIAEGRGGARGPENVWGSAATGEVNQEHYRSIVILRLYIRVL
ncbi:unnamed protein product, partial [Scytosiphon promiscuus]